PGATSDRTRPSCSDPGHGVVAYSWGPQTPGARLLSHLLRPSASHRPTSYQGRSGAVSNVPRLIECPATECRWPRVDEASCSFALTQAKDCAASYRKARPDVRKMWNRALFREIFVEQGNVVRFE